MKGKISEESYQGWKAIKYQKEKKKYQQKEDANAAEGRRLAQPLYHKSKKKREPGAIRKRNITGWRRRRRKPAGSHSGRTPESINDFNEEERKWSWIERRNWREVSKNIAKKTKKREEKKLKHYENKANILRNWSSIQTSKTLEEETQEVWREKAHASVALSNDITRNRRS